MTSNKQNDMPSNVQSDKPLEPWQWEDAQWQKIVGHVRAGRSLSPTSWPGGAPFAVALSFDSDHETG